MSANFVARELGYRMTRGWMEGDAATQEFFRPEETFADRFGAMLGEVARLGFRAIDIWSAHLNPDWATGRQIEDARRLLERNGLAVASLAVCLPNDSSRIEKICRLARALGAPVLGGGCDPAVLAGGRARLLDLLEEYGVVFGFENHPEKTPSELLDKIGGDEGRIGIAIDTGWFGTQGFDAALAARELAPRLVHVHLKDVLAPCRYSEPEDIRVPRGDGSGPTMKEIGHETCVLGDGVVPVERILVELRKAGYAGGLSIEHEPEDRNPLPDVEVSLQRLQAWLGK